MPPSATQRKRSRSRWRSLPAFQRESPAGGSAHFCFHWPGALGSVNQAKGVRFGDCCLPCRQGESRRRELRVAEFAQARKYSEGAEIVAPSGGREGSLPESLRRRLVLFAEVVRVLTRFSRAGTLLK